MCSTAGPTQIDHDIALATAGEVLGRQGDPARCRQYQAAMSVAGGVQFDVLDARVRMRECTVCAFEQGRRH